MRRPAARDAQGDCGGDRQRPVPTAAITPGTLRNGEHQSHARSPTSVSIDWYSEGETRVVEVDGVQVLVRFVGREGRRGRIAIAAPAGSVFRSIDSGRDNMAN